MFSPITFRVDFESPNRVEGKSPYFFGIKSRKIFSFVTSFDGWREVFFLCNNRNCKDNLVYRIIVLVNKVFFCILYVEFKLACYFFLDIVTDLWRGGRVVEG
ncbi:hypothetical protein ACMX04_05595, partial [Bartonella bacilliformis]|uniref:hypothetical protein n=1 Tax=Bartonella bacilliformis TaxID=774 RepID=UPI0039E4AF49